MKLEHGKHYQTRRGEKRTVIKGMSSTFALLDPDKMEVTTQFYPSLEHLEDNLYVILIPVSSDTKDTKDTEETEETVKSLRKKGWKVRVMHFRKRKYTPFSFRNSKMSEKGGRTVVELTSPEGKNSEGTAFCHPDDNYNKKEGVKLALKRALAYTNLNLKN